MNRDRESSSLIVFNDSIDLCYLQKIGKNDPRFILQMLQSFASTAQLIRERLSSAVKSQDHQIVADELHKLVFALGVVGANQALASVRGLEEKVKEGKLGQDEIEKYCNQLDQVLESLTAEAHSRSKEFSETI